MNVALYQTEPDARLRSKDVERDRVLTALAAAHLPPRARSHHVKSPSGRTSVSSVLLQGWPAPMRSEVEAMCTEKAKRVQ